MLDYDIETIPISSRVSRRAKHISARLTEQGIEVVLPVGATMDQAKPLLNKHQAWFESKWQALQANLADKPDMESWPLKLPIKALNTTAIINIELKDGFYYLDCQLTDPYTARFSLGKQIQPLIVTMYIAEWLRGVAQRIMEPRMLYYADKMGLAYQGFYIVLHKSQWGSCSPDKYIALNAGLLFFDMPVIDYVCIHELAHLKYMNHSRTFWNLVARYCPKHGMIKQELKRGALHLPAWLYAPDLLSMPEQHQIHQDNQGRHSIE